MNGIKYETREDVLDYPLLYEIKKGSRIAKIGGCCHTSLLFIFLSHSERYCCMHEIFIAFLTSNLVAK